MAEDRNTSSVQEDAKMTIASEMFEPYHAALWEPETHPYVYGTSAEVEQKLKMAGINLRRELLQTSHNDFDAWTALVMPSSVHQATSALADLIALIPKEDKEQFKPLGEANVVMSLRMMEKYLLPTIRLMEFLHEKSLEKGLPNLPGGLEVAAIYFFFLQGQLSPKERVKADLEVLRATTITDDFGLRGQLQSEASNVDTTATQMRNILLNLQKICTLPEYDDLLMRGKEYLHKKQGEVDSLIALYQTHHQADYDTAHLMIIMLSHLVQKQAMENLELNERIVEEAYEQADLNFEAVIAGPIIQSQTALNDTVQKLLLENNAQINRALEATKDSINPYDAKDIKSVLSKHKDSLKDLVTKNALLVAENSKLRMYLLFMPVQYRDFAAHQQQTNSALYQDQRREPKAITPSDAHLKGGEIRCAPAPMSHPSVQECMRDTVYSTLDQSKATFDQALKLKKRLTEDSSTKRIPLKATAVTKHDTISSTGPTERTRTTDNWYHDLGASDSPPSQSNRDWFA
jgi:hypothetical protein